MGENAQFSLAIAVGIFGVLAIFASINDHQKPEFFNNALWMQSQNIIVIGGVLSAAYWALILFGIQTYVSRRLFEGVMGDYLKKMNEERYFNDIKEIAKENKLVNWMFKVIWSSNHVRKERYKGMYKVLSLYIGIAFLLWLFVILL